METPAAAPYRLWKSPDGQRTGSGPRGNWLLADIALRRYAPAGCRRVIGGPGTRCPAGSALAVAAGPLWESTSRLELDMLPALSVANVRELLQATMPLPQLSPEQATRSVVKHFVNRSRSTQSRLRAQHKARGPS